METKSAKVKTINFIFSSSSFYGQKLQKRTVNCAKSETIADFYTKLNQKKLIFGFTDTIREK